MVYYLLLIIFWIVRSQRIVLSDTLFISTHPTSEQIHYYSTNASLDVIANIFVFNIEEPPICTWSKQIGAFTTTDAAVVVRCKETNLSPASSVLPSIRCHYYSKIRIQGVIIDETKVVINITCNRTSSLQSEITSDSFHLTFQGTDASLFLSSRC